MNKSAPSFAGRAILAVILLIGFYALALAIVGVLLYILYAMIVYGNRIDGRALVGILLASGTILWSLVPRRDKFVAPGPSINPQKEPEFFATVQEIADATQQSMPVEIYVDPQINAWVANRGGIMGIGSRRIMGIGLPLLQTLTVDQFRAVLAHEFGHYHGGDTNLGPWIYQTRSVIGRTIQNLAGQGSIMHKPFLWYGNMYLRVTHAISRQQEYAADALAATVVGAQHLIDGLKKVNASAMAFDAYWNRSFGPVLNSGHRTPLVAGFATFLTAEPIQEAMANVTEELMQASNHSPYDTHPPLPMRIDAVADLRQGDKSDHDPLAITLLNDVASLEREFFAMIADANKIAPFKEIDWHETGSAVYLPFWTDITNANQQPIADLHFRDLPELASDTAQISQRFPSESLDESKARAYGLVGMAISVILNQKGWDLQTRLHDDAYFTQEDQEIHPFSLLDKLAQGTIAAEDWINLCEQNDLADILLSESQTAQTAQTT